MYFPKFWSRGTGRANDVRTEAWGWSDSSSEEAATLGASRAQRVAEAIERGDKAKRYLYGSNPLREPVLEQLDFGAVTRNGYGCEVLNTESVLFCDIDLEQGRRGSGGIFSGLFGKKAASGMSPAEETAMVKVRNWVDDNSKWGIQAYRTKAGLRLIATHDVFDPVGAPAARFFEAVSADKHFRLLCKVQKSFRARLTPKPWRCGCKVPPARWPFLGQQQERAFAEWQRGYEAAGARNAVCGRLETLGDTSTHPAVEAAIRFHDARTKADSGPAVGLVRTHTYVGWQAF